MAAQVKGASVLDALGLSERHRSQVSPEFMAGMAARMAMSFEKYGDYRDGFPHKLDAIASAQQRLDKYAETGNTEYLMDAANFLMIEFMAPRHPDAHFIAEDSAQSPGRVGHDGAFGQSANTHDHENVRRGGIRGSTAGGFYRSEGD